MECKYFEYVSLIEPYGVASKMFAIQNLTWSLEFVILKKSQRWHHFSFKLSLKLKISTKKHIANYS